MSTIVLGRRGDQLQIAAMNFGHVIAVCLLCRFLAWAVRRARCLAAGWGHVRFSVADITWRLAELRAGGAWPRGDHAMTEPMSGSGTAGARPARPRGWVRARDARLANIQR